MPRHKATTEKRWTIKIMDNILISKWVSPWVTLWLMMKEFQPPHRLQGDICSELGGKGRLRPCSQTPSLRAVLTQTPQAGVWADRTFQSQARRTGSLQGNRCSWNNKKSGGPTETAQSSNTNNEGFLKCNKDRKPSWESLRHLVPR